MPLKLNKISDAAVREDIANNRERLEKFLAAPASSPMRSDAVRYSRRLSDAALELGLELYQQDGDVPEIRRYLGLAGKELFTVLSISRPDAVLSPLEFEKALALAVGFCAPPVYENASGIPMEKFFADPNALAFYAVLARYLAVLRDFASTGKLNHEAWKRVEAECTRSNAARYDAQVNLAKLNALRSIVEGDSKRFNEGIAVLVEDHENEARRGENQRSTRGFICLPALMFAHLGAARGVTCTVDSLYLPLRLLNPHNGQ
jgi:Immunity protein 49